MFIFQITSPAPVADKAGGITKGEFAINQAKMKEEWVQAAKSMNEIRGHINGVLGGNTQSFGKLLDGIKKLNEQVKNSPFLSKDPSLQGALMQMNEAPNLIGSSPDGATIVKLFVNLDAWASYVELKLAAYLKLDEIMVALDGGKLDEAKKLMNDALKVVGGRLWAANADVFLGAMRESLKNDFANSKTTGDAKENCERIYNDVKSIPVGATVQLQEVEITGVKKRTLMGKIVRFAFSPADIAEGYAKMKEGNLEKDGYLVQEGFFQLVLGSIGTLADVGTFMTMKAPGAVGKSWLKRQVLGASFKGSAAHFRMSAMKKLSEDFTAKELKVFLQNNLFKEFKKELASVSVASVDAPTKVFAKDLLKTFEKELVGGLVNRMGTSLTEAQVKNIVANETAVLFKNVLDNVMLKIGNRELSDKAITEIVEKEFTKVFTKNVVKTLSRNVSYELSSVAMEAEVNALRMAATGLYYRPLIKSLDDAVKTVGTDEWLTKVCEVATAGKRVAVKGVGVGSKKLRKLDELVPALSDRLKESFADAFKGVDAKILEKAGMTARVNELIARVVKKIEGATLLDDTLLAGIVKEELSATTVALRASVETEMKNAVLTGAVNTLLKGESKKALEGAAKDGGVSLTGKIWQKLPVELRRLGFDDVALGMITDTAAVQKVVAAEAAAMAKKAASTDLLMKKVGTDILEGAMVDQADIRASGRLVGQFLASKGWRLLGPKTSEQVGKILASPRYIAPPLGWVGPGVVGETGALVGDIGILGAKGFAWTGKKIWSKAQYTSIPTALTGRLTHAGAVGIEEAYDKKVKVPIKYAEVLPGEGIATVAFKYFSSNNNGTLYVKIDGKGPAELMVYGGKITDGTVENSLGFGRHTIEISAQKDFDRKTAVVVNIRPLMYDLKDDAVVIYAPNGARLADRDLVLASDGRKDFCKTDGNGNLLLGRMDKAGKITYSTFAPENDRQYQVLSKSGVQLGDFTVSDGKVLANQSLPASAGSGQQAAAVGEAEVRQLIRANTNGELVFEDKDKAEGISLLVQKGTRTIDLCPRDENGAVIIEKDGTVKLDISQLAGMPKSKADGHENDWEILYTVKGITTANQIYLPASMVPAETKPAESAPVPVVKQVTVDELVKGIKLSKEQQTAVNKIKAATGQGDMFVAKAEYLIGKKVKDLIAENPEKTMTEPEKLALREKMVKTVLKAYSDPDPEIGGKNALIIEK